MLSRYNAQMSTQPNLHVVENSMNNQKKANKQKKIKNFVLNDLSNRFRW